MCHRQYDKLLECVIVNMINYYSVSSETMVGDCCDNVLTVSSQSTGCK